MLSKIETLLQQDQFTHTELVQLLNATGPEKTAVFTRAAEIKKQFVGNKVYFRGLVELSNICSKSDGSEEEYRLSCLSGGESVW